MCHNNTAIADFGGFVFSAKLVRRTENIERGTSSERNVGSLSKTRASDINSFVCWTQYEHVLKDRNTKCKSC